MFLSISLRSIGNSLTYSNDKIVGIWLAEERKKSSEGDFVRLFLRSRGEKTDKSAQTKLQESLTAELNVLLNYQFRLRNS